MSVAAVAVHLLAQPSVTDGDYLNPASTAGIGGATLATGLTAANVTVRRTSDIDEALGWARAGSTTLFVPAPGLLNEYSDAALTTMPTSTRVVLVDPPTTTLIDSGAPVDEVSDSWAEFPATAGCAAPETAAAPMGRHRPALLRRRARHHQLLRRIRRTAATTPTCGWSDAADPFRNDRIGEHGNAALATALLVRPRAASSGSTSTTSNRGRSHGPSADEPVQRATARGRNRPAPPTTVQLASPSCSRPGCGRSSACSCWSVLVLAIAAGRRLGPPVTEPMPVTAQARETVEGRGRLYRRARQPAAAFAALRAAAIRQLPGPTRR